MPFSSATPFRYQRGRLMADRVPLATLARRFGTPCFVISAGAVRHAVRELQEGFGEFSPFVCYAVKANDTLAILRLVAREGCGAEIVSSGELYRARRAGIPASRIIFSGVGKTAEEIAAAIKSRVLLFNVESLPELRLIARVARGLGARAPVALRINPHVDAHTHRYITTGTPENKFGIDYARAEQAFVEAARTPGIDLAGIHTHIGSQITAPGPFVTAIRRINGLLERLFRRGVVLRFRNLGGGFGIAYRTGGSRLDVPALVRALAPHLRGWGMRIVLEPGRFVVGEAGVLLTRVIYVKRGVRKTFVIVDAGMDNLIRPCLYEAYHEIRPCALRRGRRHVVDVVGPICESADFLGTGRRMPLTREGDLLAVLGAGAYGSVMSSNYNGRLRAAEVMVDGSRVRLIRRRERLAELVARER